MTPLEIVGVTALSYLVGKLIFRSIMPRSNQTVDLDVAIEHMNNAIREAFQSGMLCAADMMTHQGHEEAAGIIRKTVEYVQLANDNRKP